MTTAKKCATCGTDLESDCCEECGGDGGTGQSNCIDDMCNGGDVPCMHGDDTEYTCEPCGGTGGIDYCPRCCNASHEPQGLRPEGK